MKIDDVKPDDIKVVINAILKNCNISDLDMYNNLFENRVSIFKYILENYFHKIEGPLGCADKARYVARWVDKSLKDNRYYPLKETYRDYQNRGGNIGGITELDEICYWCPESLDTTGQALQIIFKIMQGERV